MQHLSFLSLDTSRDFSSSHFSITALKETLEETVAISNEFKQD